MKNIILATLVIFFVATTSFISCTHETKSNLKAEKSSDNLDTLIVKYKHESNNSYDIDFFSKSYSYYWLIGKDTLDFVINATEHQKDSTLHLNIYHKQPILLPTALTKISECIPLIKEDFYISKLKSFYFKSPIYYSDLTKELSTEYEKQFGRKNISYEKLNQFLLNSNLNNQLDNFVNPFDKKVKRYSIEKFHLTDKKYFGNYLPNVDLKEYPKFAINGMGLSVRLENK